MAAPRTEPVRISTSRLIEQAYGAPRSGPRRTRPVAVPAVALVLLGTAALLAVAPVRPGDGSGTAASYALRSSVGRPSSAGQPETVPPETGSASASSCTGPCSTTQVVAVSVRAGRLEVTAASSSVVVQVDADGSGRARLSGLRVTDLRGVGTGWTLSTRVVSVIVARTAHALPSADVTVTPTCTLIAGPLTLQNAPASVVRVGGTAPLCVVPLASRGSLAGGAVSAYADLTVHGATPGTMLRVELATSVG